MHDSSSTVFGPAKIRPLTADDLLIVRRLLSERDGRDWDAESTRWFVEGLDPERCRAWAAFDGEKPVGLTTAFLRKLTIDGQQQRVAYWANLYVDPKYRDQMLYPRLPVTMLNALKGLAAPFLYVTVRIPQVAKGHMGLGFAQIGKMQVLARPLRPTRFLAKYKKLGAAARMLAEPVDATYRAVVALKGARVPPGRCIVENNVDDAPLHVIADLLAERASGRISQAWNAEALRHRYRQTREGGKYRFITAFSREELTALAIYRVAERGEGIQVGVIMDLAFRPGAEADAAAVLRRIECDATAADCELLIYLDGLGAQNRELLLWRGFRSSPEVYEFLIWPKKVTAEDPWVGDWNRWEFGFRDHDAF
jgi:predicted N-acetyltransferase YhbS